MSALTEDGPVDAKNYGRFLIYSTLAVLGLHFCTVIDRGRISRYRLTLSTLISALKVGCLIISMHSNWLIRFHKY